MQANLSGAIYGTISVGALLAAESAQRETYVETIGAVGLALILSGAAHAYASSAAKRLEDEQHLTPKGLIEAMTHEVAILAGAAVPLLMLVAFGIAGAALSTAVTAAIWSAAAMIVGIEVTAAIRVGARGRELAAQTAVGIGLGLLVIAINAVLH